METKKAIEKQKPSKQIDTESMESNMRKRFGNLENIPLHVMGHCNLAKWPASMDVTWKIFQEVIDEMQFEYDLRTHAFVLMENHYHWLCTYDVEMDPGLFEWVHEIVNSQFLQHLPMNLCGLATLENEPNVVKIKNFPQYKATYRYVYNNPVSAGITTSPLDYNYSSLPYVLGKPGLKFHVIDNMGSIYDPFGALQWLEGENLIAVH